MLLAAKRPMIYAGGGVIFDGSSAKLRTLVDRLNYPITTTLMGIGGYPGTGEAQPWHARYAHGTYEANMAMQRRRGTGHWRTL